MHRRDVCLWLVLGAAGSVGSVGCDTGAPPVAGIAGEVVLSFPEVARPWIGPRLQACRLQDWRLAGGRLHCRTGRRNFPLRTAMLLTADVAGHGDLELRVRTGWSSRGPGDVEVEADGAVPSPAGPGTEDGFRGFLIGAGNPSIDPRISALVHHRPAADGGLLAVVDAWGRVAFFDNGVPAASGNLWSIAGPLQDGELPRLAASTAVAGPPRHEVVLELVVERRSEASMLRLTARDPASGAVLGAVRLDGVASDRTDGLVGLVSHRTPPAGGGEFWFDDLRVRGSTLRSHAERASGPIHFVLYTVSRGVLKLTAQLPPLGPDDPREATLRLADGDGVWRDVARATVVPHSWTATFRVPGRDVTQPARFEVAYALEDDDGRSKEFAYGGTLRHEPPGDRPVTLASLNCAKHFTGSLAWNHDAIWYPHAETARGVAATDPDLIVFTGDQLYEGDLDPADTRDEDTLLLDYLTKWMRFGASFGELTRRHPTITIPDDHDVYQGNLWGAGGRRAVADPSRGLSAQDSGGYVHSPRFVNAVHRTQTSHLPDPVDPAPVEQGLGVYFTELVWGGVSVAILADRQWKSSASDLVPAGQVVNGWFRSSSFDPRLADVAGAELLGQRQEAFLERWAADWSGGVWTKVCVSQTPFVNVATLPDQAADGSVLPRLPVPEPGVVPEGYRFAADTDSGGWPQTPRRRAVSSLRRALAFHLAGDQHLGSLIEYGVESHRDAGFAFTAPAIANAWPRRWWPPFGGARREPGAPYYTGDFRDGFGNHLTVWAVANPLRSGREPAALHDRSPGFGLVRLDPSTRAITFECWPRGADPTASAAGQYPGWPRTIHPFANGPPAAGFLELRTEGCATAVLTVKDSVDEVLYTWRTNDATTRLPVPGPGPWIVEAWDEARDRRLRSPALEIGGVAVLNFASARHGAGAGGPSR